MKYIYIPVLFVAFSSCTDNLYLGKNSKYLILSKDNYQKQMSLVDNKVINSLNFYYILNNLMTKKTDFKKIISESIDENEKILAAICEMIYSKKINYETEFVSNNSEADKFILGLYYFSINRYLEANKVLKDLKIVEYSYFYKLLTSDIEYEITKKTNKFDQKIEIYQKLMDITEEEISKDIIKQRIRIIRYED